jgi:hypothetical protein
MLLFFSLVYISEEVTIHGLIDCNVVHFENKTL